jgi:hypothetical protein
MNCQCEVQLRVAVAEADTFDRYREAYKAWQVFLVEGCQCQRLADKAMASDLAEARSDPGFAYDLALTTAELTKLSQCEQAWAEHESC